MKGRNWNSARDRDRRASSARDAVAFGSLDNDQLLEVLDRPSKADLRAEAAALAAGVKITRLPTVRRLHCRVCQHQGTVTHPPGVTPTFRCKKCGAKL